MPLSLDVLHALARLTRDMPPLDRDRLQADLRMNAEFGVEMPLGVIVKEIIKDKSPSEQIEIKQQIIDLLTGEQDSVAANRLLDLKKAGSKRMKRKRTKRTVKK